MIYLPVVAIHYITRSHQSESDEEGKLAFDSIYGYTSNVYNFPGLQQHTTN